MDYFSAVQAAADRTNEFNAEQAQLNREWQEYMSNTSHQREVADLKAAGLNPVLSARSGASTPSGSAASGADASGAIAGLFGQLINAQSAQAIAEKQIASAQLLETMKEIHDEDMKLKYPNNWVSGLGSLLQQLFPSEDGKSGGNTLFNFVRGEVTGPAWKIFSKLFKGTNLLPELASMLGDYHTHKGKF